jgi:hypothetical protein
MFIIPTEIEFPIILSALPIFLADFAGIRFIIPFLQGRAMAGLGPGHPAPKLQVTSNEK